MKNVDARTEPVSVLSIYYEACEYSGLDIVQDLLQPLAPQLKFHLREIRHFRHLCTSMPEDVDDNDGCLHFHLEALLDWILLRRWPTESEHLRPFLTDLGLTLIENSADFDPAIHEIVQVDNDAMLEDGVVVTGLAWPAVMFGELVVLRAGVSLRCSPDHGIVKEVAEKSELYFTEGARSRRPTRFIGEDWGHNSRWGFAGHRTYLTDNYVFFNVDCSDDVGKDNWHHKDVVPISTARELLANRCLVADGEPLKHDVFPYSWSLCMRRDAPRWPIDASNIVDRHAALEEVGSNPRRFSLLLEPDGPRKAPLLDADAVRNLLPAISRSNSGHL